jgi:hypothetical protein
MRGGAQAHLLEADDGHYYVVKFQNNPQHRRILINELASSEILQHLGIASPEYRVVIVSRDFLRDNPDIYIQGGKRRVYVEQGAHFGSRYAGDRDTLPIFDLVQDALLARVLNREQFHAVLVFDRWVANADGRQGVFIPMPEQRSADNGLQQSQCFRVLMIDHGFAFNAEHWTLPESALLGLYARRAVYADIHGLVDFNPWMASIQAFPSSKLDAILQSVPEEWIGRDRDALEKLFEKLFRRQKRIETIMLACRDDPSVPFPNWKLGARAVSV